MDKNEQSASKPLDSKEGSAEVLAFPNFPGWGQESHKQAEIAKEAMAQAEILKLAKNSGKKDQSRTETRPEQPPPAA